MYWNLWVCSGVKSSGQDKLQHEMYWNRQETLFANNHWPDKLQHEMYWNCRPLFFKSVWCMINYNMRCIETKFCNEKRDLRSWINYNMRCIETKKKERIKMKAGDKLQHEMYWNDKTIEEFRRDIEDKLQHEMYWNFMLIQIQSTAI